ncbi:MAG: glutamate-5-semialdehyde dehydrogenase [Candidatus Saganbacteria bacterium]|uniref:Gamma-glutamyl phosphate reductase n=1 Tax=Candidatus Saganbacteria bacterium TaxID=2575572 RepID=A0A833NS55_UNCSA|nr:MAG: glutamate-5-semialdehyde dehydrogenase [Candidatus Saganbacteria bacterium]
MNEVLEKAQAAKFASRKLANVPAKIKDDALSSIASQLEKNAKDIIESNSIDLEAGEKKGLSKGLLDRLALDGSRIKGMVEGLYTIKNLADPIGEIISEWRRPNGLKIKKVRVPLGVVGIIYEARPNVTVDSAALCLKSGNAVILRGGTDAINSNIMLTKIIREAAYKAGIPDGSIQLIEDTSRDSAEYFMKLREYIDVLIPRGGKSLIQTVVQKSLIPTIETGEGNCHAYVEKTADLKMAAEIVLNAKCSRPSVCNAVESLLVDEAIAAKFLPMIYARLRNANVEIRGDEKALAVDKTIKLAVEDDWSTEFLSLVLAVKVVKGVEDAVEHINKYGTKHSETIITKDKVSAKYFTNNVDAAAVYVNASTRFTDGFEFGFGAEIGISTQKLHARGPMGLKELTSYKYVISGAGQVRAV